MVMTDMSSLYTNSKMDKEFDLKRITKDTKSISFYSPSVQNKTFYNSPLYKLGGINSIDFERSKLNSQQISNEFSISNKGKLINPISRMTVVNQC